MKTNLITALVLAALPSLGFAQTTYTWTGGAADGDWTTPGNWSPSVPVSDGASGGLALPSADKIIFTGSSMPTLNLPTIGGVYSGGGTANQNGQQSTPTMEFLADGEISFATDTPTGGFVTNSDGFDRQIWTVGDAAGTNTFTLNITNALMLERHGNGTHRFTVNPGGVLNFAGNVTTTYKAGTVNTRMAVFDINGGQMNVAGNINRLTGGCYIEFTSVGGSVTAQYGGSFGNFAAVENAIASSGGFRSGDPLAVGLVATDLGVDVGFTVTAVEPPPPNYWTGTGGATWDNVTDNFALNTPANPLDVGSLAEVKLIPSTDVAFGDEYFYDDTSAAVAENSLTIADEGVEIGGVNFLNNSADYTITSTGFFGIKGDSAVSVLGTGSVTLLGIHNYTGTTSVAADGTLTVGDLTTATNTINNSASINNLGTLNLLNIAATYANTISNSGALVFNLSAGLPNSATITGDGTVEKTGTGTLSFPNAATWTGPTTVSEGTMKFSASLASNNISITSGAILDLASSTGIDFPNMTFSGSGTLLKSGAGLFRWRGPIATFALSPGALINVQAGNFTGGANGNDVWTDNMSNLTVASGATFAGTESNVRVDALNGSGLITTGFLGATPLPVPYEDFTVGVANGSGTFEGVISNNGGHIGSLTKEGTGSQILGGKNTYTGDTTIEDGTLTFLKDGQLIFAPTITISVDPETEIETIILDNNTLKGTAGGTPTANLNGTMFIDLGGATNPMVGQSWQLIDQTDLTVNYDADFTVNSSIGAATEADGVWTLDDGIYAWYFDESTGVLSYGTSQNAKLWTGINGPTWDASSTANWTNNPPADPLSVVTFATATATTMAAQFADTYFHSDGGPTAPAETNPSIASGGVETGLIEFFNDSLAFTVDSSDANGLMGATAVRLRGIGAVTLRGIHAYTGGTTIDVDSSLSIGDETTDGSIAASAITNNGLLSFTNAGAVSQDAAISGSGSLVKSGTGNLTLSAANTYAGDTTINDGTLTLQGDSNSRSFDLVEPTSLLDINHDVANQLDLGATTFTGLGTITKTGIGPVRWGNASAVFMLSSGALIDVQAGSFVGGSFNDEVWIGNLSDLNVEADAIFNGAEANVEVDELTGAGTIMSGGDPDAGYYYEFGFGLDNGTASFDGVLADNNAFAGNFTKFGTGIQTLTGMNTYTGNTYVDGGALNVTATGGLVFVPTFVDSFDEVNEVSGSGTTMDFDGKIYLDLSAANTNPGTAWMLFDQFGMTVTFGANAHVDSSLGMFTETANVWTLDTGGNLWTFDESTGVLEVEEGTLGYASWLSNYPDLSDTSPTADPEFDSIENLLEYVLNGNPEVSDTGILPGLDSSGADFVFTFDRLAISDTDTIQVFQYGSTLTGWTDLSITAPTAAEVNIGTADVNGVQTVTVTISKSLAVDGKLFGRLNVITNP